MERIFLFLYHYRAFFTFLVLQLFCSWLIVENNQYQGASFFNSSNSFVANINGFSQNVSEYFSLREVNEMLAEENTRLRKSLEERNRSFSDLVLGGHTDSTIIKRFDFVTAKVVNNSVSRFTNFITINKGSNEGIEAGMAVISPQGVVGKVKMTSDHFSVVTSVLNIDIMISGVMKRTGYFGTIQWDGDNAEFTRLNFIPRHVDPQPGDTIITSGYSGIFPEGILIGTIAEKNLRDGAPFYDLKVKFSQDFRKLTYVAVVKSNLLPELDSLEQKIPDLQR
ncbi:MAG TPA: rod shape-determining protein MreC [Cyclobacteriaceae bacterium]|nr:rod shape-determining protein MreC [Cyclobacteriaceae bacterium]